MPEKNICQPTKATGFEVIEHTADWSIRVWGGDTRELFISAAIGMACLLVDNVESLPKNEEREIRLKAFDTETLLVDWLSELAFWAEDEQLVFHEFELEIASDTSLRATVRGGRAVQLVKHIKAVTYHELVIETIDKRVETTIVFDV